MRRANSTSPLRQMVADLALLQADDQQAILAGLDVSQREQVEALLEALHGTPLPSSRDDLGSVGSDPSPVDVIQLSAVLDQLSDDLAVSVLASCPTKIQRKLNYMLSDERRAQLTTQPARRLTPAVQDVLRQVAPLVQLDPAHKSTLKNPSLMSQLFARALHRSTVF